jgi:hypothetical protein
MKFNQSSYWHSTVSGWRGAVVWTTALLLSGCGGGDSGPDYAPSLGVQVTGLNSGASFVLTDMKGDQLTVSASGNVAFQVKAVAGTAYALSIPAQPAGEFCNIQNAAGTLGSTAASITIACAQLPAGGTGSIAAAGGAFTSAAADVTVPAGASLTAQTVTVATEAPPSGMPTALVPIGAAIDVAIDQPTKLNAPLVVTLRYDASIVADESNLAVVHYNTSTNKYEPTTILAQDTTAHSFTIASRVFSPFVVVSYNPTTALPASHMVTNFTPQKNGWNIENGATFFTPDGFCLGMAAYAIWYFEHGSGNLNGAFPTSGSPSVAQVLAMRAFLAQSQYWADQSLAYENKLGVVQTAKLMQLYLSVFDEPLILLLDTDAGTDGHASVLYGYDSSSFTFYDVNDINQVKTVPFDGTNFGLYEGEYDKFTFVVSDSLGRTEDFAELTTEAESGFTSSKSITVNSPDVTAPITTAPITLSGALGTGLDPNTQLVAFIPGTTTPTSPVVLTSAPGDYSYSIATPMLGTSTVVLLAGIQDSQQNDWYPNSAAYFFSMNFQSDTQVVASGQPLQPGQTEYVYAKNPGVAPGTARYHWTLSGTGSIGGGTTAITNVPAISYTAPSMPGTDTLSVNIVGPGDSILSTGTGTIVTGNPWVGTWDGTTTSICGYYSGPQDFTITQVNATTLNFGPYDATFSGNTATVNGGEVVFTLNGNTMTGTEADSCQTGTYTRQ